MPNDRRKPTSRRARETSLPSARVRARLRGVAALGLATACAATSSVDPSGEAHEQPGEPRPGSTLPGPSPATPGPPRADAAAIDAAGDGGLAPAPEPGAPCPVVDAIIARPCGLCGSQEAVCLSDPSRAWGGTVSPYGPCHDELTDGCVPGSTEVEACGNCGTLSKTCTRYCTWHRGVCKQAPGACVPTTHEITTAGCSGEGFRVRACTSSCTWTDYPATCAPLDLELPIAPTPGMEARAILPLSALSVGRRPRGACPSASLSATTNHPQLYVELVNTTDKTALVSVWNARAPDGPEMDTVMAAYDGATRPATEAERAACRHGVADTCPPGLGCEKQLAGLKDVSVPPLGSVLIWFGAYYEVGATGAGTSEGKVALVVRTEALQ